MTTTPQKASGEKTDLVTLTIDGVQVSVAKDTLVIRAAEEIGVSVPRFCDHPLLAPVGACRQCLVDIPDAGNGRGFPKPQASCTLPVAEGMVVNTQATSPVADKAQQGMMEFLLINHPLDCPVCDKGGECPLQNQAMSNGRGESRFSATGGVKRTFPKPINISPQILLDRERCIVCQRCTRFADEIAGDPFIALVERGAQQQIGVAKDAPFLSYFAGNTIQICPVGALTSEDYRFRSRPFDLVSTPSVAEHDACGAAIRVDHRRGKVMRRLSGNDPQVNEEWISDKDRFAFHYATEPDRITYPRIREDGELRPASWPEAFAVAARGLEAAGAGAVLTGGRVTAEDAYAYAKFARVALQTNDIDFRSRPHTAEEASFLASHVALSGGVDYAALEAAPVVVLLGLEPEDEAATIFLRLRKASRKGTQVLSVAPYTSRGLAKMRGRLVATAPGAEVETIGSLKDAEHGVTKDAVILVGERLAQTHGALSAAAELAATTGARLAWVPRRAGDRGAVESGALPNLLPGGRPVSEADARVDVAAAWGSDSLPAKAGRDGDSIIAALAKGDLGGLVVGGVDPDDTSDPAAFRAALDAAGFVVSLELRETDVTRVADVVLPVAPVTDKAGTFVTWEGRTRPFDAVFTNPASLPDLRILAGIADELGTPLGFRTVAEVRSEMEALGPWDGARPALDAGKAPKPAKAPKKSGRTMALASWKQLVDLGSMQDGEEHLRATARRPVVRVSQASYDAVFGMLEGAPLATVTGDRGSVTLPVEVADLPDDVVWVPARSFGRGVLAELASPGSPVIVTSGDTLEVVQ
jgi:NADH-quinone oxidoreductase subunit G